MPSCADLDPETRRQAQAIALREIRYFGARDDPAAIEKLAAAGREAEGASPAGDGLAGVVSDVMEEMAADLRSRQQGIAAALGSMGALLRLSVRA
jgi:hypothetical protein